MLSALAHSHGEGVVHRDIKPANIMLLENDTVKIADFGIARMEESEFTQTGMVMGTPQYISPEQRLGQRVDARTDLYSTGAVLYELLTGQKASPGMSANTLWSRINDAETTKLETTDAKTQRIFHTVVVKALAKDPDDRFASAQEFSQAIANARPTPESEKSRRPQGIWFGLIAGIVVITVAYLLSKPAQHEIAVSPAKPAVLDIEKPVKTRSNRLTDEETRKIDSQLRVAKTHMLVGRLISPPGSNAFHSYQLVLKLDPGNAEARLGVASLQDKLLARIEQSITNGDFQRADDEISLGLQKFPDSVKLLAVKQQVE